MLPPALVGSSKPLTPGTVMGIRSTGVQKHSPSNPSSLSEQHGGSGGPNSRMGSSNASPESSSGSSGPKGKGKADHSVRFADQPLQRSSSLSRAASSKSKSASAKDDDDDDDDEAGGDDDAGAATPTVGSGSSGAPRVLGLESRRTSHKAAEQKRRDSLKYCFDELRGYLPNITLDEEAPSGSTLCPDGFAQDAGEEGFDWDEVRRVKLQQEMGVLPPMPPRPGMAPPPPPPYTSAPRGSVERMHRQERELAARRLANKGISKVALLRHSNEYLVRLKKRLERREEAVEVLEMERDHWRDKFLGLEGQLRGLGAAAVAAAAAAASASASVPVSAAGVEAGGVGNGMMPPMGGPMSGNGNGNLAGLMVSGNPSVAAALQDFLAGLAVNGGGPLSGPEGSLGNGGGGGGMVDEMETGGDT
ncbi:unnamed protein product [Tilletia controversa]|nr:unnamed protein product [Tilletia controversa]CAD6976832.1 unnamed protein product [Tilletia controversa]